MDNLPPDSASPKWASTTKLVVGLTLVALVAAALFYFRSIIGPLILAIILAFLFHPVAAWYSKTFKMSWKASVNIIYLSLVVILIAALTLSGLAILQQTQSLVSFIDRFITGLPTMVQDLSTQVYMIGPFQLDFSQLDLEALATQVLDVVQPLLGQAGGLVGSLATTTATTLAWGLFVLLVSYFLLSESGQLRENLINIDIPGYSADVEKLVRRLVSIWNDFLRGQLIISLLVVISYYLLLTILGTRLALAIALLAGIARFIPYLGSWITWIVTAIVAYLQTSNYFGLEPIQYAALVIILIVILDMIFDSLVVPRFLGTTLGVHPAGVLIAAIIAANLIGLIGLILAAPVLATLNLLGRYILRKMFDLDPWPEGEEEIAPEPKELPWIRFGRHLVEQLRRLRQRFIRRP